MLTLDVNDLGPFTSCCTLLYDFFNLSDYSYTWPLQLTWQKQILMSKITRAMESRLISKTTKAIYGAAPTAVAGEKLAVKDNESYGVKFDFKDNESYGANSTGENQYYGVNFDVRVKENECQGGAAASPTSKHKRDKFGQRNRT